MLALALWALLFIALSDATTQSIPDVLNGALLLAAIASAVLHGTLDWRAPFIGLGFLGGQWVLSRGAWIGSGDVFLGIGMGVLLGEWRLMMLALFASYILGALYVSLLLLLKKKKMADYTAFGPFLVMGTCVSLWWGQSMLGLLFP